MEELKQMGLITANEFVTFIKPFIINEEEALKNMITFFEIWDVKVYLIMWVQAVVKYIKSVCENCKYTYIYIFFFNL